MKQSEILQGITSYLVHEGCSNIHLLLSYESQGKYTFQALDSDKIITYYKFELSDDQQQCYVQSKKWNETEYQHYDMLED